jgi:KaiC/GvpD/RAD55 family RecA-like ATPase
VRLRQAVNDVLEEFSDLTPESVGLVDEALRIAGRATLSELRRKYSATYKRILNRGIINSETDYYMINAIVTNLASGISAEERELLEEMLDRYEAMANRPLHPTAFGVG